ncbi:DUF3750 domain-containing protein [Piscirickettsia litoralis]|uniref:DUF3750 domain-containing protein n=1 Tax=Piscirickettsia litoralis TaxID=1891921 RepID=A0ABX2ZYX1_9GAMM|nr:DUF3750 domain-containing protein [Piscirickettsia litoralis]ODN41589.1 hypothetical protein BGC07_15935 [Piscirickettsia litoralis]
MLLKVISIVVIVLLVFLLGPLWLAVMGKVQFGQDWRTADRSSTGIAPKANRAKEAIVQVYEAKAFNWRGLFAVHTWISVKPQGADHYTNYQVIGWNAYHGRPIIDISSGAPDRMWFGHEPKVIKTILGKPAQAMIPKIEQAVKSYPYPKTYQAWPGPNSNTFIAYVLSHVPELGVAMPANALGKDYVPLRQMISQVPSKTGYRLSLLGVFGLAVSSQEGVQVNLLGLTLGLSWRPWGVIVPGVGLIPEVKDDHNYGQSTKATVVESTSQQ